MKFYWFVISLISSCIVASLILIANAVAMNDSFRTPAIQAIKDVFPASTQSKAIQVADCESVHFTDQYNESSGAKGIFQVIPENDNRLLVYHGHGLRIDYDRLYDFRYSARVALFMSKGGWDWHEWDCG